MRNKDRMAWLREQLKDGPVPTREIKRGADDLGVTMDALRISAKKLGVEFYKEPEFHGIWYWKLPDSGMDLDDEVEEVFFVKGKPIDLGRYYRIKKTGEVLIGSDLIARLRNK